MLIIHHYIGYLIYPRAIRAHLYVIAPIPLSYFLIEQSHLLIIQYPHHIAI